MSQRRLELFRDHFRVISRMNRLSKFNDHDGNLKVVKFLTQFGSNIHNRTQPFITMINLNDIDRHVAYLVHIMLIVCWLNRKHLMSDAIIVIFEVLSKKFMYHFFMFVSCCLEYILTLFRWNQHNFKIFARFWSIFVKDLVTISTRSRSILMKNLDEISINLDLKSHRSFDQHEFKISIRSRSTLI